MTSGGAFCWHNYQNVPMPPSPSSSATSDERMLHPDQMCLPPGSDTLLALGRELFFQGKQSHRNPIRNGGPARGSILKTVHPYHPYLGTIRPNFSQQGAQLIKLESESERPEQIIPAPARIVFQGAQRPSQIFPAASPHPRANQIFQASLVTQDVRSLDDELELSDLMMTTPDVLSPPPAPRFCELKHPEEVIQPEPQKALVQKALAVVKSEKKVSKSNVKGKCVHGRRPSRCKDCGGSGICTHGRQRSQCRDCGGGGICIHGKRRSRCKPCGGKGICEHGRQNDQCKICGGTGICEHSRRRSNCKDCASVYIGRTVQGSQPGVVIGFRTSGCRYTVRYEDGTLENLTRKALKQMLPPAFEEIKNESQICTTVKEEAAATAPGWPMCVIEYSI